MGIHSDWMKVFKEECPTAFSPTPPCKLPAGFIDGQIQLMKSTHVISWDQFVQYQFVTPVRRMLRERGASVVVLAFDDYTHVPRAKGMTQAKRAKKTAPLDFHERAQLPDMIPACWDSAIMNRTFKMRVIQMVISRLPQLLGLLSGEQLIIDYMGPPQLFVGTSDASTPAPTALTELEPIGEADLKFFRYAERFGGLLVMATDSDYLPISMLRLHTQFSGRDAPRVVLQRLRVTLPADKAADKTVDKAGAKGRKIEFIDVNMLLGGVLQAFRQCSPACVQEHSHAPHYISMLCSMIAMFGGTDFTRGMPQVGPKRIWDALGKLLPAMVRSYDADRGQLREAVAVDDLVARVYAHVFASHVSGVGRGGFGGVASSLSGSKLAVSTKGRIPSMDFVMTTVRNANWVLLYWAGQRVDELSGDFGYKPVGKRLTYADVV